VEHRLAVKLLPLLVEVDSLQLAGPRPLGSNGSTPCRKAGEDVTARAPSSISRWTFGEAREGLIRARGLCNGQNGRLRRPFVSRSQPYFNREADSARITATPSTIFPDDPTET
jgi:hypothetical protein